jgi:L-seryl-tRNA(Ser) seleniumtransferase
MKNQSIYERLGVRPLINGMGTYTVLGGSLMPPEVLRAMAEAAGSFVSIPELREKVGVRIAGLLGVPAAMVTAGAASSISAATAACMTFGDPSAPDRLPDATGLRNEVILQRSHRTGYEPQIELNGARLVWVETRAELDRAINDKTAMLFFLNFAEPIGAISRAEWIEIGKAHGVPTFLDAAADVPPASRLSQYVDDGFDLVAFSGGKGLRGPQATGLLLGRADLIAAAETTISPNDGIGRAMKVGKEEIVGLLAAVERYMTLDHDAEWREWQTRAESIVEVLKNVPTVTARIDVPPIANHAPQVVVAWFGETIKTDAETVASRLLAGDPPIALLVEGPHSLRIAVWTLQDDEPAVVARRIGEILQA